MSAFSKIFCPRSRVNNTFFAPVKARIYKQTGRYIKHRCTSSLFSQKWKQIIGNTFQWEKSACLGCTTVRTYRQTTVNFQRAFSRKHSTCSAIKNRRLTCIYYDIIQRGYSSRDRTRSVKRK